MILIDNKKCLNLSKSHIYNNPNSNEDFVQIIEKKTLLVLFIKLYLALKKTRLDNFICGHRIILLDLRQTCIDLKD